MITVLGSFFLGPRMEERMDFGALGHINLA